MFVNLEPVWQDTETEEEHSKAEQEQTGHDARRVPDFTR